jgi:hypothetical protein
VNAVAPRLRSDMTTREVVEELTEQPGSQCAGCHAGSINPLGFATEGFDALGRARSEQRLFSAQGEPAGSRPIDTASVPRVMAGDERRSAGPGDLMALMLESGKLEACLARQYFRFTYGRFEDVRRDGCELERLRETLLAGGSVAQLLKQAALSPQFRWRVFE